MSHEEGEGDYMSQAWSPEKKKWRYDCGLFRTNGLKAGAVWNVDPLLGNQRRISKYTIDVAKQLVTSALLQKELTCSELKRMTKSVRNMLYFIISDYLSTCTFITD
jgi:hypothetical protein